MSWVWAVKSKSKALRPFKVDPVLTIYENLKPVFTQSVLHYRREMSTTKSWIALTDLFIFIWKTWILSFSIFILAKVSNLDTHKHGNKEFNKLSLYTCTLVIWKKLVINQNFNKKRRFYCIDMKADRCTLWIRTMNISIFYRFYKFLYKIIC